MNTTKITETEIKDFKIASLPSRPTAPAAFGGRGYTAADMKAAFDKLPLYIIERFNSLIDDVSDADEGGLAAAIPTGIYDGHTLKGFFSDILSGSSAAYLSLGDETLNELRDRIDEALRKFADDIEVCFRHITDFTIDGGSPDSRREAIEEV